MSNEEMSAQVADQCKVVAGLAKNLMDVHLDYEHLFRLGKMSNLSDSVGRRTALFMETLVTDDDSWMDPIFEKAHSLWSPAPNDGGGL